MKVSELSGAIERELTLYMETSTETVKNAVRETAEDIRNEIRSGAPVGKSGMYAKSWRTRQTEDTPTSTTYTVYAGKGGYPLAHLLEFGHAKRGGGRTKAIPHIKPAEEHGAAELEAKIRSRLR